MRDLVREEFLFQLRIREMQRQDAESYALLPQDPDEVVVWETVQDWGGGWSDTDRDGC